MTDLLNRPPTSRDDRRGGRRGSTKRGRAGLVGRLRRPAASSRQPASAQHALTGRAALAAAVAAAGTMLACMGVALIGWFLADAGAHGQTTDALRVGADVWLAGHGSGIWVRGVPLAMVPLAVTAALAWACLRAGRRAGAGGRAGGRAGGKANRPVPDDVTVAIAATTFTGVYVVVGVVTAVVAGTDTITPSVGRTVLGTLLLAGLFGTLGIASGTGRLAVWVERVPGWIRAVATGAAATALLFLACASVLALGALLWHLHDAASMLSGLRLGPGDYVAYVVATAAVAPNAVVFAAAYLLGPGFAVGTGTVVSPTLVTLGPVPAFPLLAALPGDGPVPSWLVGVVAVPVLCAGAGAVLAQRRYRVTAYDSAALRGFGTGLGAALLLTLAAVLARGPLGDGRMAEIGPSPSEVLVAATMAMSSAGLVAGLVTAWWQRRSTDRAR